MKFTSAILIVALAAALVAIVNAAEEITASSGGTGSGCPDTTACTKSCKKQGYSVGICLEPLLTVCACL
uniref:Putative defensin-like protein n=1 Tax=Rhipicephalus microplus TaxID=6941 RepID=A0A6M2CVC5_RHIMP